jgi:hypothetical protein
MTSLKKIARIAGTMVSLLILAAPMRAQAVSEYEVKALFIYNFAKFIEWPPEAFSVSREPITVCIAGQDPFGSEIDQAVKGKTVNSRELAIKRIGKSDDLKGCQILFIGSAEKKYAKFLLSSAGVGVLSVGESDGFTEMGGVIGFAMDGNKVRFDINLEAAERAHIKISSKLLSLARYVKEPGKQ